MCLWNIATIITEVVAAAVAEVVVVVIIVVVVVDPRSKAPACEAFTKNL